ncbi:helix-turn-helix domain-containing protein [Listeria seeligeri]|uniref:helix-turn-helix domain-containing protein n=1 Tax=Listeria seeligeri TaxID=1640 RepID=UPI001626056E|nr:helix-turn-helix domain-containing protein [Listeria seeligeri]MBC1822970.1 helix-turn-helix domain-containing protein [Listeria seeligeri]MBC1837021.1 helix-turn-helix domain-containing protein [Listeria seeligeri]MBF2359106.1 helix-turn-helix domain-containing protein [Listeria seeligeri]MBF2496655.1 helix-turn-helix domain-containing protein [Listeria seeligeri]MBF2540751.1 helix-turn-helix domain-containing protein [Listeria seeligeri]
MPHLQDYAIGVERVKRPTSEISLGTKVVFAISGQINIKIAEENFELQEGDILVLDRNTFYTIEGDKENLLINLTISDTFFAHYYEEYFQHSFKFFSRESDPGRERIVGTLRKSVSELLITSTTRTRANKLEAQTALFQILLLLTRFLKKQIPSSTRKEVNDKRISRMIREVEERFDETLSLREFAQKEFLSEAYLSRYFKKTTGLGFLQYLTEVRLKHALQNIIHSTESITDIALKNGFSSQKHFSEVFKAHFSVTPSEYRTKHHSDFSKVEQETTVQTSSNMEQIKPTSDILIKLTSLYQEMEPRTDLNEAPFEEKSITVTDKSPRTLEKNMHILTIGELKEALKEDVQRQIITTRDELGVNYIGVRYLFGGSTFLPEAETDELVPTSSPYAKADLALTFLKQHNLQLFIRLEYQDISRDEQGVFDRLDHFLRHSIQMFGREFVSKWHFMFFEPKYTSANKTDLKRLYLKVQQTIKSIFPAIQVGNFVPFSLSKNAVPTQHTWFLDIADQIDFISFNANQNEAVDFSNEDIKSFLISEDYCLAKTLKLKAFLKHHHINKPMMLINWNTLTGNTRHTNGTFFRGALVLKTMLDLAPEVNALGFWINTELHEGEGSQLNISLDGLEMFHFFNGKRPAFYAVKFFKRLKGIVVAEGEDYIITKHADGYQLILMNCATINPRYAVEEKFLKEERKEVHIRIKGFEAGEYQVCKWLFDRDNGALYSKYWQLNSKHGLDKEILDYIVDASQPTLTVSDETITEDWSFYAYLDINAIHFYEFRHTI